MRTRYMSSYTAFQVAVSLLALAPAAGFGQEKADLPQVGKSPVKVFVLAGQSNMEGHGTIAGDGPGRLETLVKDPATSARFKHLRDTQGNWMVREDVWITFNGANKGALTVGGFAAPGCIGPELAFGEVVGDYLDNQVLLIKFGYGGTSLAGPWRPPSSGGTVGGCYSGMISAIKKQLANLAKDFPGYDNKGFEIVGFGWHQGWNDGCVTSDTLAYGANLANLIRDVRKELGVPNLPFVIGGSGFGGWEQGNRRRLRIMKEQESVAQLEEFKGNVAYVETRGFFRSGKQSPRPLAFHWCYNAETYYLIGESMGKAMVELLGGPKAPANEVNPLPPKREYAPPAPITVAELDALSLDLGGNVTMKLLKIPAGTFMMGSPENEEGRQINEGPRHEVKIEKPFYVGVYEVTVAQFNRFVKATGYEWEAPGYSFPARDDHPVTGVRSADSLAFCKWLSEKTGKTVSLPTEAQWEYACRAGTSTSYYYGNDPDALAGYAHFDFDGWDGSKMNSPWFAPVGLFKPNAFGLYDMHGNVRELCSDANSDSYGSAPVKAEPESGPDEPFRVLRGGDWRSQPDSCRSASRASRKPNRLDRRDGFRVVVL